MSRIIKTGRICSLAEVDQIKDKLPLGTYNLVFIPMIGFRLEQVEDFKLPPKIYGDTSIVDRSIAVYKHRERNFGLLLAGLRGSGKSLLMKKIAVQLNQPIIIVNQSFRDVSDDFIKFLTDPALGDCTIIFDEFEKRFDSEDVTPLTLMDGPYNTHHFFILTVNKSHINENLINRPGRIYYHKKYIGIDDDTVREVGKDLLLNQEFLDELVETCEEIRDLSFDMLISLINDINLFNESPKKCVKHFGFDNSTDYVYATINQIFSNGVTEEVAKDILLGPDNRYVWIDEASYFLNDGQRRYTSLRLDFDKATKINKSKYRCSYELSYDRTDEDEDKSNFTKQTLEFEINLHPNKTPNLFF